MKKQQEERLLMRRATPRDLEEIARVEAQCFPAAEAASAEVLAERLKYYADHFWLLFAGDCLVSFVDGMVTDEPDLSDEMYEQAQMHNEQGRWQMIFGVNTLPAYRQRGYANRLLRQVIGEARQQGRSGLVLTCKEEKIPFYSRLGFVSEGKSRSVHGSALWYQMRLRFEE